MPTKYLLINKNNIDVQWISVGLFLIRSIKILDLFLIVQNQLIWNILNNGIFTNFGDAAFSIIVNECEIFRRFIL